MADYETEEEQIEALKNWWSENGNSLLITIAVGMIAVFGFRSWQTSVQEQGEQASTLYQDLMETVLVAPNEILDETKLSTGKYLADMLKNEHESSAYAKFASLVMAKQAVEASDLETAEAELRWVLDHGAGGSIELITRLRLAKVLSEKGDAQAALSLIESVQAGAHTSSYEEVKGDIYLKLGRPGDARSAYQRAMNSLTQNSAKPFLQMKLDDIELLPQKPITSEPVAESTQPPEQTEPQAISDEPIAESTQPTGQTEPEGNSEPIAETAQPGEQTEPEEI